VAHPADADAFARFWAVYPRPAAKFAAEKAFAKAIELASADVIIEGARRYAGERAGQDPKYTKHPATWLRGGCWDDPAPRADGPPIIDQAGNVVHLPQQQPTRNSGGILSVAEAIKAHFRAAEAAGEDVPEFWRTKRAEMRS
jgi:hypothetical protein